MLPLVLSLFLVATPVHAEELKPPVHVEAAHTPPIEVLIKITPQYREQQVALAFADTPRMVSVARCESRFHQFNSDGTPLHSKTDDWGLLQIHGTWIPLSKKMGLDIKHSAEDNIEFAKYILKTQGIKAWSCSRKAAV